MGKKYPSISVVPTDIGEIVEQETPLIILPLKPIHFYFRLAVCLAP
jgi:hypothetical protein